MKIYCLPLTDITWGPSEDALLAFVSDARRARIAKYHMPSAKVLSLYAALLTRKELSHTTGIPAAKLQFCETVNHKPTLRNIPGIDFSYSHTQDFILCAISEKCAVGADVERVKPAPAAVMKRAFCEEEIHYVSHPCFSDERFFEIWTKKEAYTKCLGTGLTTDLHAVCTLSEELSAHFHSFSYDEYVCSIYSEDALSAPPILRTLPEVQEYFLP